MKQVLLYFLLVVSTGCSTVGKQNSLPACKLADVLEELSLTQRRFNDTSKHEKVFASYKGFDPTKAIFKKLENELRNSKSILYQFTWQNDLPMVTGNFRAILLDQTSGKRYYCSGSGNLRKLDIRTIASGQELVDEKVLSSYLSGNFGYINSFQKRYSSAEVGQDYNIYEIEIQEPRVTLKNFVSVAMVIEKPRN